jgi:hypothetical protein
MYSWHGLKSTSLSGDCSVNVNIGDGECGSLVDYFSLQPQYRPDQIQSIETSRTAISDRTGAHMTRYVCGTFESSTEALPPLAQSSLHETFITKLFPSEHLGAALLLGFEELELYYPCVDRLEFYSRLSELFILQSSCHAGSTRVESTPECIALAALTCVLAAIGTFLGPDPCSSTGEAASTKDERRQKSLIWYEESTRLVGKFEVYEQPNIDILRYYIMTTIYMSMLERKSGVSRSHALAVDMAHSLNIHDEQKWPSCSPREREFRRLIWCTLVYIDCRIALNFQRPLLLSLPYAKVGPFTDISVLHYMDKEIEGEGRHDCSKTMGLAWPLPVRVPDNFHLWLLFLMQWGDLVTRVWYPGLPSQAEAQAVSSISTVDDSLAEIQDSLAPSLRWAEESLPDAIKTRHLDRECRLKVLVYEVCPALI